MIRKNDYNKLFLKNYTYNSWDCAHNNNKKHTHRMWRIIEQKQITQWKENQAINTTTRYMWFDQSQAYIHWQRQSLWFIIKITSTQDLTIYIAPTTICKHTKLLETNLSLTSLQPSLVYVENLQPIFSHLCRRSPTNLFYQSLE